MGLNSSSFCYRLTHALSINSYIWSTKYLNEFCVPQSLKRVKTAKFHKPEGIMEQKVSL